MSLPDKISEAFDILRNTPSPVSITFERGPKYVKFKKIDNDNVVITINNSIDIIERTVNKNIAQSLFRESIVLANFDMFLPSHIILKDSTGETILYPPVTILTPSDIGSSKYIDGNIKRRSKRKSKRRSKRKSKKRSKKR